MHTRLIEPGLKARRRVSGKSAWFSGGILTILVVFILFGSDSAGQDLVTPRLETLRGTVQAVVADHFDSRSSKLSYSLQLDGLCVPISSPTASIRAAAQTGEPLTVTGSRINGVIYPLPEAVGEETALAQTVPQAAALAVWNVIIIPVSFTNAPTLLINQTNANQIITDRLKRSTRRCLTELFQCKRT